MQILPLREKIPKNDIFFVSKKIPIYNSSLCTSFSLIFGQKYLVKLF